MTIKDHIIKKFFGNYLPKFYQNADDETRQKITDAFRKALKEMKD